MSNKEPDKKPADKKQLDQLLGSNYDGIQEYDNDLPRWWLMLFYLTLLFGVGYVVFIHLLDSPTDMQTVASELAAFKQAAKKKAASDSDLTEEKILALIGEPPRVEKGKDIFAAKCAACHGPKGEGLVGPNLTDEFWIHGSSALSVKHTIENGVLQKGMLGWKGVISDQDILDVMSYLWSIRNTNLAGKAAEGTK